MTVFNLGNESNFAVEIQVEKGIKKYTQGHILTNETGTFHVAFKPLGSLPSLLPLHTSIFIVDGFSLRDAFDMECHLGKIQLFLFLKRYILLVRPRLSSNLESSHLCLPIS